MANAIMLVVTGGAPETFGVMILFAIATAVGASACQSLLAALFSRLLQPAGVPVIKRFHFWHGLNRFSSGFLVALLPGSVLGPAVMGVLNYYSVSWGWVVMVQVLCFAPLVCAAVMWWSALGRMVAERASAETLRLAFAIAMIPVIGVLSGLLGLLVAWALGFAFCA